MSSKCSSHLHHPHYTHPLHYSSIVSWAAVCPTAPPPRAPPDDLPGAPAPAWPGAGRAPAAGAVPAAVWSWPAGGWPTLRFSAPKWWSNRTRRRQRQRVHRWARAGIFCSRSAPAWWVLQLNHYLLLLHRDIERLFRLFGHLATPRSPNTVK